MITIIAGSRTLTRFADVRQAIASCPWTPTEVVSGLAAGPDLLGRKWALNRSIPVTEFPADWRTLGKRAGYLRNQQMADYAESLIAVWDGLSRGTLHMINIARKAGLRVHVYKVKHAPKKPTGT